MRFLHSLALTGLFLVLFLFSSPFDAGAAVWVEQIHGNPQAVIISRNGNFMQAKEMMRLKAGDVVKVLDEKSSLRLLLGSGKIKSISRDSSPYRIAGKQKGSSFLANLMGEVKKMLVASADETEAVAMMTRGRSRQLAMLAAGADENLVPAGAAPLTIGWQGGKAPFRISLTRGDDEKPLMFKAGLLATQMTFDPANIGSRELGAGEYQLLLEDGDEKSPSSSEIDLLLVEKEELPEKAQKLLSLGLDKRVEARIMINLLHEQPEWRLYAYSLAAQYGLEKERKMLGAMR